MGCPSKSFPQLSGQIFGPGIFKILSFLPEDVFKKYIDEASVVISHAGSGALFNAIKKGKKTITVARLKKYHEMVDDHQTELAKKLSEEGYIIDGTYSLVDAARKIANHFDATIESIPYPKKDLIIESGSTFFNSTKLEALTNYSNYQDLETIFNNK